MHVALCTLLSEERILSDGKTPQLPLAGVPGVLFRVNGSRRTAAYTLACPSKKGPTRPGFWKVHLDPSGFGESQV